MKELKLTEEQKDKFMEAFYKLGSVDAAIDLAERMILTFIAEDIFGMLDGRNINLTSPGSIDLEAEFAYKLPIRWVVGHDYFTGNLFRQWAYKISSYYPNISISVNVLGNDRVETVKGLVSQLRNDQRALVSLDQITADEMRDLSALQFDIGDKLILVGGIQTKSHVYVDNDSEIGLEKALNGKIDIDHGKLDIIEWCEVMINPVIINPHEITTNGPVENTFVHIGVSGIVVSKHRYKSTHLSTIMHKLKEGGIVLKYKHDLTKESFELFVALVCASCGILCP